MRALQNTLLQEPVLALWDPQAPTRVFTDASQVGIGAILQQQINNECYRIGQTMICQTLTLRGSPKWVRQAQGPEGTRRLLEIPLGIRRH